MTRARFYSTDKPQSQLGPLLPMSREDATFWRLRRERQKAKGQES